MCPHATNGDVQKHQWQSIFTSPIAGRLNALAPGANLNGSDIYNLMAMCPFETAATMKESPFCGLFTADEFASFEYLIDLDKFYGFGSVNGTFSFNFSLSHHYDSYGQPFGRIQGVGYVNELLARLTGKPVNDSTQTNRTLDSSNVTFPLGRTLYVDFSHDNTMAAIYTAIGLFNQSTILGFPGDLDPESPDPRRTWIAANLVPFAARMVTEKISCSPGLSRAASTHYVRILVNDAVQPLEFCRGSQGGLCELEAFLDSQSYSTSSGGGDFEKCGYRSVALSYS